MAGLKTKPEYTGVMEAVSLGIALLKKCKANTWGELTTSMAAGDAATVKIFRSLELGDRQLQVLQENQEFLDLLRISPAVVPAFCSTCGEFVLTSDTAPTKCMVSSDCAGKPFKVIGATGAKEIPEDDRPDVDTPASVPEHDDAQSAGPEPASSPEPEDAQPLDEAPAFQDFEEGAVFVDEAF